MDLVSKEAIKHLSKDAHLKVLIDQITLPERTVAKDVYSGLIQSIVSQQLSVKAAGTIHKRFLSLFKNEYPDALKLISADDGELRSAGLSGQKTKYVKNVAQFFIEQHLFDTNWSEKSDEDIVDELTQIKGVGKWTVQMILMFVLKREDVFPILDLGIQQGIAELYNIKVEKKELLLRMEQISEPWRPYRTTACLYLWAIKQLNQNDSM